MAGHVVKVSVVAETTKFSRAFNSLAQETGLSKLASLGEQAARTFAMVGAAALAAGAATGAKAISLAGDLQQSAGAVQDIFKQGAGQMVQFASQATTSVGVTRNQYNEMASIIGAQLKNAGVPMDQLAGKTNDLITRGADMAAMFGGTTSDAVEALSSALKGERDPIERYGVSLKQAQIDAKAAAMGFGDVSSQQAQQAATLQLIAEQTADASGKFGRESDTWAHQVQVIKARITDFVTALGEKLLPAATSVATWFAETGEPALERLADTIIARAGPAIDKLAAWFTTTALPALQQFGAWFTAEGLPALTSFAGFLTGTLIPGIASLAGGISEHLGLIAGLAAPILLVVGAWQTYNKVLAIVKAAQAAYNAVTTIATALKAAYAFGTYGQIAADQGFAVMLAGVAGALRTKAVALGEGIAAGAASVASTAAQIASTVAHGVALGAQKVALGLSAAAQWALNAAMSANPIAIVVLAIAALVAALVLLYMKNETVRNAINAAWNAIKSAIGAVADWITGTAVPGIVDAFNWFTGLPARFASWFGSARDRAVDAIGGMLSEVRALPGRAASALAGLAGSLWNAAWSGFHRLIDAASSGGDGAVTLVAGLPMRIAGQLAGLGGLLFNHGASILQGFLDGLKSIWNNITGFVGNIAGWIRDHKGPISYDRTLLVPAGKAIMDGLVGGLAAQMPALASQLAQVTDTIAGTSASLTVPTITATNLAQGRADDSRPIIVVQALDVTADTGRRIAEVLDQWHGMNGASR